MALSAGYFLSTKRPLENDELFTHVSSVEGLAYQDILAIKIAEGNVSPLFYLTQKIFLDVIHFRLPFVWSSQWYVFDLSSQIALRSLANFYMSLSIVSVFYFFARFYSLWAGVYGVLVSFSSFMILQYWTVARPYALWNFLTTGQILLFLYLLRGGNREKLMWRFLVFVHWLLALTVTFSAVQVAAVSLFLYFCKDRDLKKYIFMTLLPVVLCLVYYFGAPKYNFYFTDTAVQLICASFPKERLVLVLLLGGFVCGSVFGKGEGIVLAKLQDYKVAYMFFIGLMLILTGALMGLFYFKAQGQREGFPLSNRYFIYLTPIGIIAVTLFTAEAWKALFGRRWFQSGLFLLVSSLLLFRLYWSWQLVRSSYGF